MWTNHLLYFFSVVCKMKERTDILLITVIGGDTFKTTRSVLIRLGISWANVINLVNDSRFGNFKTITVSMELSASDIIDVRKQTMKELDKEITHLLPMYRHREWMHVYIFDRRAFIE